AAALYGELGEAESAARVFGAAYEIDPNDPAVLAARAPLPVGLGRIEEAIADAERVNALDPNAGRDLLLVVLGHAADAATDPAAQKALRRRVAELYSAAGRKEEAHAQLEQLLSLDERDTETLWAMARIEEAASRFDVASDT